MARSKKISNPLTLAIQDLGLSENEALLYTLMVPRAPSTVQELGIQSPFPRTLLYHVLDQLIVRGLVKSKKDGWRTTYIAESPDNLYDLLAKKEQEAEKQGDLIRNVIPQLKQNYLLAGNRPSVRVFEGVEEFEKALDDIFVSGSKEVYAFEHLVDRKPAYESRFSFERRRVLRKVRKNVLFFESKETLGILAERSYNDYTSYRGIAGSIKAFETDMLLYGGKVLYITGYGTHEPIAILIEDKELYSMQKNVFDLLWTTGKDRTLYYTEVK